MISFLPKPYPDEILYSILARYHIRSGNTSPKATLKELFNSQTTIATIDLPSNLDYLIKNLQLISNYQIEDLIYKHTLYPFYSPFLPPNRANQVLESMKGDYGGNIHTRAGIMASSMTMPKYFRFCPTCLEEDLNKYGESYWHRIHQAPGVLVCPFHRQILQNSIVSLQGFNRHEYYAASIKNCPVNSQEKIYNSETIDKLLILAQDILWVINNKLPSQELNWFRKRYINLMITNSLATVTGRVHQKRLLDNFLLFYGSEVLNAVNSMVSYTDENNWVSSIVRKHRKSFHPIRHLLMMRFLQTSPEEFFQQNYEYKPFGDPPWLCLNAAADHYRKPVITNLSITLCCDTKKPVGTFSCACGMVYCRTGPDQNEEDKLRIGKIKAFGEVWEQKLKVLVEVEKLGLRETARQLHVDARTVVRHVTRLQLKTHWRTEKEYNLVDSQEQEQVTFNSVSDERIKHRQIWIDLQSNYPEASKTELRQLAKAIYAWLYRNDRDWLNQNSPVLQVAVPSVPKVNWQQRDREILVKVQDAVKVILNADKPARITLCKIGKTIGLVALLEKHLDQMPLTKAYLESVVETVEEFQIRRIKWAIKYLIDHGVEVVYWKVVKIAGLREDCSETVKAALEYELAQQYKKETRSQPRL